MLHVVAYSSDLPLSDYTAAGVLSKWTRDLSILTVHNGSSEAVPSYNQNGRATITHSHTVPGVVGTT